MFLAKFGMGLLAFMMSGLAWFLLCAVPKIMREMTDADERVLLLYLRFMGLVCAIFAIGTWWFTFSL
jgi:hypothetical protein